MLGTLSNAGQAIGGASLIECRRQSTTESWWCGLLQAQYVLWNTHNVRAVRARTMAFTPGEPQSDVVSNMRVRRYFWDHRGRGGVPSSRRNTEG